MQSRGMSRSAQDRMMRGVVALIVATAGAFFVPATNLRNGQGPAPRAARAGGPAVHQRGAYAPWGGRYGGEAPRPFLLPLVFVSGVCAAAVRGGFSALNSSPRANSRMLGWFSADSGRQDDDRLPKFGWPGRVAGEFMRHAYQNNPYGGKGVDREEAVSENSVRSDLERVGRSDWAHLIERKER